MGSPTVGGRWSSPSDVDLVDLDRERPQPPSRTWGRRETDVTAGAAALVALATVLALLWPQPEAEEDVVGLTGRPEVAWVAEPERGGSLQAVADCAVGGIALLGSSEDGRSTLACRSAADGDELWRHTCDDVPAALLSAPESPLVVLFDERVRHATVISRDSGREVATIRLPAVNVAAGDLSPLALSDRGMVLVNSSTPGDWEGVTIRAIDVRHPGRLLWTTRIERSRAGRSLSFGAEPLVEYGGFLWDRDDTSDAGYVLAISAADGSLPQWSAASDLMTFSGDVVVGTIAGRGVVAYDLASGRTLWAKERRTMSVASGDGAFFLVEPVTVPSSLDAVSGLRTRQHIASRVTRIDPRSGRERWVSVIDHPTRIAAVMGEGLLVAEDNFFTPWNAGEAALSMVDARTGEPGWTRRFPQGRLGFVRGADGVVVAELVGPTSLTAHSDGERTAWLAGHDSMVVGVDLETGVDRWRLGLGQGAATVIGRHLVVGDESGAVTIYR